MRIPSTTAPRARATAPRARAICLALCLAATAPQAQAFRLGALITRARAPKPLQKPDARKAWLDAAVVGPLPNMEGPAWLDAALRLAKRDAEAFVPELHATLTDTVVYVPASSSEKRLRLSPAQVVARCHAQGRLRGRLPARGAVGGDEGALRALDGRALRSAAGRGHRRAPTRRSIGAALRGVPDGTPRAPQAPQGARHLPSRGRHPRRRRGLEGLGRAPAPPARPHAARLQQCTNHDLHAIDTMLTRLTG